MSCGESLGCCPGAQFFSELVQGVDAIVALTTQTRVMRVDLARDLARKLTETCELRHLTVTKEGAIKKSTSIGVVADALFKQIKRQKQWSKNHQATARSIVRLALVFVYIAFIANKKSVKKVDEITDEDLQSYQVDKKKPYGPFLRVASAEKESDEGDLGKAKAKAQAQAQALTLAQSQARQAQDQALAKAQQAQALEKALAQAKAKEAEAQSQVQSLAKALAEAQQAQALTQANQAQAQAHAALLEPVQGPHCALAAEEGPLPELAEPEQDEDEAELAPAEVQEPQDGSLGALANAASAAAYSVGGGAAAPTRSSRSSAAYSGGGGAAATRRSSRLDESTDTCLKLQKILAILQGQADDIMRGRASKFTLTGTTIGSLTCSEVLSCPDVVKIMSSVDQLFRVEVQGVVRSDYDAAAFAALLSHPSLKNTIVAINAGEASGRAHSLNSQLLRALHGTSVVAVYLDNGLSPSDRKQIQAAVDDNYAKLGQELKNRLVSNGKDLLQHCSTVKASGLSTCGKRKADAAAADDDADDDADDVADDDADDDDDSSSSSSSDDEGSTTTQETKASEDSAPAVGAVEQPIIVLTLSCTTEDGTKMINAHKDPRIIATLQFLSARAANVKVRFV